MRGPGYGIVVGTATLIAVGMVLSAQGQRAPATLDDVLAELRGLRADLSRSSTATARMQLLTARLSLQEQRIAALARQHAEVTVRFTEAARQRSEAEARSKRVETEQFPPEMPRSEIEGVRAEFKRQVAQSVEAEQRLRTEEAELTRLISAEQSRWTEFNSRLDDLERSLTAPGR
jgi:chromosome segregation ATPase